MTAQTPDPSTPRLSKRLSELGLCSRREAEQWIVNGWVTVNGEVIDVLGSRVKREDTIEVNQAAKDSQDLQVTVLLNKPIGYVSGQPEDNHEPAIKLVELDNRWEQDGTRVRYVPSHRQGLATAGRLDIDSTGLLVMTQDGRIARHLIGNDTKIEKEYLVRVTGEMTANGLARLQRGLSLDGRELKPAKVSWQNEHQLRFVLREGRKRQIRRMCEQVGLTVTGLKRIRIGSVALGGLPIGQWRYLNSGEKF